ncbi:hypothetical protein [Escherichia phage vB_EcoM_JNE01]|nr:hypothetical protein [Escherichia phage vB_EcoM_JNE01]
MDTKFTIKFLDEPCIPYIGDRFKPYGAKEVTHPDGKTIYLAPASYERAVEMLIMNSKYCKDKYISYLYNEHVLDFNDENMFVLVVSDFSTWHEHLLY